MKLDALASSTTTSLVLKHPVSGDDLPVTIHGFTPDSEEWKRAEKDIVNPNRKQSLILEKGRSHIELDSDSAEKRRKLLSVAITGIDGLDDWTFSRAAINKLFADPKYGWMLEQWGEHLDARENFFGSAAKTAKTGSKA